MPDFHRNGEGFSVKNEATVARVAPEKNFVAIPRSADIFALQNFSQSLPMSQHPSLKSSGGSVGAKRSVMKRFERVKLMKKRGQWKAGQSALALPKTLPEL